MRKALDEKIRPRITEVTDGGCWIARPLTGEGRLMVNVAGHDGWLASRLMWLIFTGPQAGGKVPLAWGHPDGMVLGHTCLGGENPLCVNPLHLTPLSKSANKSQSDDPVLDLLTGSVPHLLDTNPMHQRVQAWADEHGLPVVLLEPESVMAALKRAQIRVDAESGGATGSP